MPASTRTVGWLGGALLCLWVLHANVSPGFTPVRSEISNARGFSRGLLNFVVLPADQSFHRAPDWSLFVCAAVFLLLGGVGPGKGDGSPLPSPFSMLAGLGGTLLVAVALSPYGSPYRIVLAPRTFVLCLLLLCAPRVFAGVTTAGRRTTLNETTRRRLAIASCGALGAAFFGSAMIQTLITYGGNYSGFLHLSRDVAIHAPFLQQRPDLARSLIVYDAGYDGQFIYLMAFDPFLQRFKDRPQQYRSVVDAPPYRYGRIGFSLLTDAVSVGRPERYPAAMMWLIVAAHFALAALLASIAMRHGLSPLAGLWYLAIPSFTSSLLSALPEALAAAGIVLGLVCWETRRPVFAALSFGAALLVRETGVVLLVALLATSGRQDWKRTTLVVGAALVPVCAWRLFVGSRLFTDFGWQAVLANPGDLGVPFAGLIDLWTAGMARTQAAPEIAAAVVYPALLTGALALAVRLLWDRRGPLELAAVLYGVIAVSLNYDKIWSHVPSGERGTFELFVCLLLLLLESRGRPVWVRHSLTALFVALAIYTFAIAPDAATSRAALLVIR